MSRKKVHFWLNFVHDTICQYASRAEDDFDDTTDPSKVTCRNCLRHLPTRNSKGWKRLVKSHKRAQEILTEEDARLLRGIPAPLKVLVPVKIGK